LNIFRCSGVKISEFIEIKLWTLYVYKVK
jgi:hypothetical protein